MSEEQSVIPEQEVTAPEPETTLSTAPAVEPGIKGFLIVMAIMMIVSPIAIALEAWVQNHEIFGTDLWFELTDSDPVLAGLIVVELAVNGVMIIGSLYLLVLFFGRKKSFPKMFIILRLAFLGFLILDNAAAMMILSKSDFSLYEALPPLMKSALYTVAWIAYLKRSERVKVTFVE